MVNKKTDQCEGCGIIDTLKTEVISVRHKHPTAHKAQKRVLAIVKFESVNREEPMALCQTCQNLIIGGLHSGQNWE